MAPTKDDPLHERMLHAFGQKRIDRCFENMLTRGVNLLDLLTDEAREELLRCCIVSHKLQRKFAAESRAVYRLKRRFE
jgi:hypothetical protein